MATLSAPSFCIVTGFIKYGKRALLNPKTCVISWMEVVIHLYHFPSLIYFWSNWFKYRRLNSNVPAVGLNVVGSNLQEAALAIQLSGDDEAIMNKTKSAP